jgi:hypothetical protein
MLLGYFPVHRAHFIFPQVRGAAMHLSANDKEVVKMQMRRREPTLIKRERKKNTWI